MDFLIVLLAGFIVLGALTRTWFAVIPPLVGVPLYVVGINRGWWGCCGTGDAWQLAMLALTAVGVVGAVLGVAVGKRLVDGSLFRR